MKKTTKILAVLLVVALAVGIFAACTKKENTPEPEAEKIKIGFIMLHDENSTYDLNFINGAKEACDKLGVEAVIKTNIPESSECYETAADLADLCRFLQP